MVGVIVVSEGVCVVAGSCGKMLEGVSVEEGMKGELCKTFNLCFSVCTVSLMSSSSVFMDLTVD